MQAPSRPGPPPSPRTALPSQWLRSPRMWGSPPTPRSTPTADGRPSPDLPTVLPAMLAPWWASFVPARAGEPEWLRPTTTPLALRAFLVAGHRRALEQAWGRVLDLSPPGLSGHRGPAVRTLVGR